MESKQPGSPRIDPTAAIRDVELGDWTAVGARTLIQETLFGDYSYVSNDCDVIYSQIGKFCSIASHVRITPAITLSGGRPSTTSHTGADPMSFTRRTTANFSTGGGPIESSWVTTCGSGTERPSCRA